MPGIIKIILKYFYILFFAKAVERTVTIKNESDSDTTELLVISVKGYSINFICRRISYIVKYKTKFLDDDCFSIYSLSAEHSDDIPEELRKVLTAIHYLPSFDSDVLSEENKRKLLIEAYVDLVTIEMQK